MTAIKNVEIVQEAASVEGLDEIFKTDMISVSDRKGSDELLGIDSTGRDDNTFLTPEEAAQIMGKSVRTIRRMLEKGSLPGYKVSGKKRDEWRIPTNGISVMSDTVSVIKTDTDRNDDRLVVELKDRIYQLEERLEKAQREIQAAAFRNGYLESQAELKDQQIKLLTDSQHKVGWWSKFRFLFKRQ